MLAKLREEYEDLCKDSLSARHAINAAMTAYHFYEWVWGGFLKSDFRLQAALKLASGKRADHEDFLRYIEQQCPAITDAQSVANGNKHFDPHNVRTGAHDGAFDHRGFGIDFDISYLWIERAGHEQLATEFVKELVDFWEGFFQAHPVP